jgi:hypothetical protein
MVLSVSPGGQVPAGSKVTVTGAFRPDGGNGAHGDGSHHGGGD